MALNMSKQMEIEALQSFLEDHDLETLEELADEFNILTALGAVHSEIRHSNFLAWLLSPAESHGLGDYFLAAFLKELTRKASVLGTEAPSLFDIDSSNLDDAEVLREWRNIDILIRSDDHRFVCALENKVRSGEGVDQLARYKSIVRAEFPSYRQLFAYLTVEGATPSEADYVALSYGEIASLVDTLMERKKDKLGSEILTFISHYKEMLRRYIVEDSEIQDICNRIYKTHKKALDLIFEYKPDRQSEIYDYLVDLISQDPALILDDSSKSSIRFLPSDWDFIPRAGEGWTSTSRIVLFEFKNSPQGLSLYLYIGPGRQEVREKLYEMAGQDLTLFNTASRKLRPKWLAIYKKTLTRPKDYEDKDAHELRQALGQKLTKIRSSDFPRIAERLSTCGREMGWLGD